MLLLAFECHRLHSDHFKSHQNTKNLLVLPVIFVREGVDFYFKLTFCFYQSWCQGNIPCLKS